jgi:hypothetical protein
MSPQSRSARLTSAPDGATLAPIRTGIVHGPERVCEIAGCDAPAMHVHGRRCGVHTFAPRLSREPLPLSPGPYVIENHAYARAATPNRVALYIAADCHDALWAGADGIAAEVAALAPGESREFPRIQWSGETRTGPITVRRER